MNESPSPLENPLPKKKQSQPKVAKKQEAEALAKSPKQIRREFLLKVKTWEEQRESIKRRKQQIEMKKKSLEMSLQQKKKKEKEGVQAFLKLEKKKVIEAKLHEIELRKAKRSQLNLAESQVKKSQSLPKYIEAEQRYKSEAHQKQIEKQILLKNRKEQLQLKMKEIKQHERAYIQRIKERLHIKSQNNDKSKHQSQSVESFNIHKKDPAEIRKIEEKIRRMKKIESKIRMMPVKVDQGKRKEADIMGDKLRNKKKYLFLSQKALSDQLIYQEFKDFDINIDNKELGNQYFEELKSKNQMGKRKVSSQKVLPSVRPEYKDYIKEIRQKRRSVLNPDEFDSMAKRLNKLKDKEAGINYLLEKSEHFEGKAIEKIHELRQMKSYHDAVRKEEQIDKNYMKAIQAKLALARLH